MSTAPEAKGFNLGTVQLEYNATFFAWSSILGILMGGAFTGTQPNAWTAFWAWGIGSQVGLLVPGADFNPTVSISKFLAGGMQDPMKLVARLVGQILGCILTCLAMWLATGDKAYTGFFPPMVDETHAFKWWNAIIMLTAFGGCSVFLLDAYGDDIISRRIAHFITYGYQAYFQFGLVGMGLNWADVLARTIMAHITGNVRGNKGGFEGHYVDDSWKALWIILIGTGVGAPLFYWGFVKYSWPQLQGFIEAEKQSRNQKNDDFAEETA